MRTSDFLKTSEGSKYLLCDGSEVSAAYPKLRSLMTHAPDLRDRVPQGSGIYAVETQIEAALPNITGFIAVPRNNGLWCSGALYYPYNGTSNSDSYSGSQGTTIGIDASRCSSIYKNDCTTVQPPALAVAFYIKAI